MSPDWPAGGWRQIKRLRSHGHRARRSCLQLGRPPHRKYVATRTLTEATWQNTSILDGDVASQVAELKAQDGPEIQVHGSWDLIQTLLRADLIDEFRPLIFPVVVGHGKRLFGDGTPPVGLVLQDLSTSSPGVIMAAWTRSGPITPGSFALEEPTELELQRRQQLGS